MIDVHGTADNTRVAEPWKKSTGLLPDGSKYPDMTFHHLIPYNTLYPFWNILLDLSDPAVMGSKEEAAAGQQCMLLFMELLGIGDTAAMHGRILQARPSAEAVHLDSTTRDDIAQKLLWTGWNIVEGPLNTIREDDPGESYDDFQRSLLLASLNNQALLAVKNRQLNGLMIDVVAQRKKVTDLKQSIRTRQGSSTPLSKSAGKKLEADLRNLPKAIGEFASSLSALDLALQDLKTSSGSLKADWQTPLTYFNAAMWFKQTEPSKAVKPWITIETHKHRTH